MPSRIRRELSACFSNNLKFDYVRLQPDFSLETEHIADDDAYASMDVHAAILYFKSRGWELISHKNFTSRFLARHEPLVVRKLSVS